MSTSNKPFIIDCSQTHLVHLNELIYVHFCAGLISKHEFSVILFIFIWLVLVSRCKLETRTYYFVIRFELSSREHFHQITDYGHLVTWDCRSSTQNRNHIIFYPPLNFNNWIKLTQNSERIRKCRSRETKSIPISKMMWVANFTNSLQTGSIIKRYKIINQHIIAQLSRRSSQLRVLASAAKRRLVKFMNEWKFRVETGNETENETLSSSLRLSNSWLSSVSFVCRRHVVTDHKKKLPSAEKCFPLLVQCVVVDCSRNLNLEPSGREKWRSQNQIIKSWSELLKIFNIE